MASAEAQLELYLALGMDDDALYDTLQSQKVEQLGLGSRAEEGDVDDGSHLYAAMFAASALWLLACMVSVCVLRSFPELGKGGLTQNAR